MAKDSSFIKSAIISNAIAAAVTILLIKIWYTAVEHPKTAIVIAIVVVIVFAMTGLTAHYFHKNYPEIKRITADLTTDSHQWAPIAAASMLAGWTGPAAFGEVGSAGTFAVGIIFSWWCVILACDAKYPDKPGADLHYNSSVKSCLMMKLLATNILAPMAIAATLSWIKGA